jgi:hypothetical protein
MQRCSTRTLYLADHRQHIGSVLISKGLNGRDGTLASLSELRAAQGNTTGFSSSQSRLGTRADHCSLFLGKRCEKVQNERVYVGA